MRIVTAGHIANLKNLYERFYSDLVYLRTHTAKDTYARITRQHLKYEQAYKLEPLLKDCVIFINSITINTKTWGFQNDQYEIEDEQYERVIFMVKLVHDLQRLGFTHNHLDGENLYDTKNLTYPLRQIKKAKKLIEGG